MTNFLSVAKIVMEVETCEGQPILIPCFQKLGKNGAFTCDKFFVGKA